MTPDFIQSLYEEPAFWAVVTALPLAIAVGVWVARNEIR